MVDIGLCELPPEKRINTAHNAVENARNEYAAAVKQEMELEDNRINFKIDAIKRIMAAGDNAMTGKPHSFSSAETIVNTDPGYAAYLEKCRVAAETRIILKGKYEASLAILQFQCNNP
jgi:hypothetical protein